MKISAAVITYNEEKNIEKCLQSLSFAGEIIVVDSGSHDKTAELAGKFTPKVYKREFDDFSSQKNFAVDQCSGEWVLSIDADEWVSPKLAREIKAICHSANTKAAYRIKRLTNLFGRDFLYSGLQKDKPVRLFIKNKARFIKPVHEVLDVKGETGDLLNELHHRSFQTVHEHLRRLQAYTDLETGQGKTSGGFFRRMMGRSFGRFVSIYFAGQGFRDGVQGFLYAVLSGYYEFVRQAKLWEKQES